MDVSVIIVNYNTKELTKQCVESIFEKTTGVEFEVIVVDNGSTDGSREVFEGDKRLHYIYSNENLGFGRANNLGFAQSKGDFLFFLNSDTYLVNNAIYMLWHNLKNAGWHLESERIACAGAMLRDAKSNIIHSYARFPSVGRTMFLDTLGTILWKLHLLKALPDASNYRSSQQREDVLFFDVDYITGADLMVRRDVAEECGLFDPAFFMYYEETEMQFRYKQMGIRRVICNGPEIVHLVGQSTRKRSPKSKTVEMRSKFLYYRKTLSPAGYILFGITYKLLYLLTRILCFPLVPGESREKIEHLKAVAKIW